MDIAIVTGAETPLGLSIVEALVEQGYRVHGIGNNFSKVTYADQQFKAYPVDLTDLDVVASTLNSILEEEKRIDCLVHAIDVTPGAAFDKLPVGNLEAILKIGLLGPVMMTRLALPNLLRFRGQLINVITANKHGHPASAANALIEGGLREMNRALFDQARDAGLRITNCLIRQNTELSEGSVSEAALAQSHINLSDVVRTIEQLIDPKAVNVPEEIVLRPRLSAAASQALPGAPLPLDPYANVVLPPKEYCPPEQPKIPTQEKQQVERSIPYTDEEMDDKIAAAIEDFEANPDRYEQPDPPKAKPRQPQNQPQGGGPQQSGGPEQEGQGNNKRRRRRRGGRNRNKNSQDRDAPKADNAPAPQQQERQQPKGKPEQPKGNPDQKRPKPNQRKPKPKLEAEASAKSEPTSAPKPVKKAAKKAAKKKTAAKKAAKKTATKKALTKKVAAKKAAKKVAKASAGSAKKQAAPKE